MALPLSWAKVSEVSQLIKLSMINVAGKRGRDRLTKDSSQSIHLPKFLYTTVNSINLILWNVN